MDRLTRQLEFVREAGRLRGVLRQTQLTGPPRRENSAEHSWQLAVMALALGELRRLWDEFEERVTPEARFTRALDRLQPTLEDVRAGGTAWRAQRVTADQVLSKVRLVEDGSAALGAFARELIGQAVRDGILAPGPAGPPESLPRAQPDADGRC